MDLTPQKLWEMRDQQAIAFPWVALDTETSGLYADDGARVATVSVAWPVTQEIAEVFAQYDNVTVRRETTTPGVKYDIVSVAWPFDQGRSDKPEAGGADTLWPDAENLPLEEWRFLLNWLDSLDLVMHNAKFDCEKMRVGVRRWPGVGADFMDQVIWDTQNVNHFLWPLDPTSLKPTCARLFGSQYADEGAIVKAYLKKAKLPTGRWDLMPWDVIGSYADMDARLTAMLYLRQTWEIANGAGNWVENKPLFTVQEIIDRRLAVTRVLYEMERRGLPYDEAESKGAAIECGVRAGQVADLLPFRPTSPAAKDFFFTNKVTSKGEPGLDHIPYSLTEKGEPSLTAEVVQRMIDDNVPHAKTWGEYAKVTSAQSMWYEGYAAAMGRDGRLRTCFRQNGTRSSRFSVERVNLQAIPQDYRLEGFEILAGIPTPRDLIASAVVKGMPGWRIYELDLAQAELRVGAMWAKDEKMLSMIVNGEDLHTFTTQEIFDRGPDDPGFGKWRQVGKRANFSLLFGSGADTFRKMVSKETGIILPDAEAGRIVREWNRLYPAFQAAIEKHMVAVETRQRRYGKGWIDLLTGERRWFQQYEDAHKAFNQRVQGNLAQFGIDWMLDTNGFLNEQSDLQERAASQGIGEVGLVLTIHDSQVLLLPDDEYGRDLAARCAGFGKDLWKDRFPDVPGDVDYHAWMA